MDLRKLKTLIDLVSESGISELEITEAEGTVRIVKGSNAPSSAPIQYINTPSTPAPAAVATPEASAAASIAAAAAIAAAVPTGNIVKSPMVGTFYRSAGPGKPAYVEIGTAVKQGGVLCIVEAMKLLNEIECEFDGVISKILVENGQPVEYGQPLFVVE
jgi:acetyl-CoA carboxylase biotin carboxyl carrier protein